MKVSKLLILSLSIIAVYYLYILIIDYMRNRMKNNLEKEGSLKIFAIIGFFVNFFDTLGIGSFAPTTAIFRNYKLVKDKVIPGTLNVALCIPIITQALIFIKSVEVDSVTLISMILSACLGSILGAKHVVNFSENKIQKFMAVALLVVAFLILAGKFKFMPVGGVATSLSGWRLVIGILGNFILGFLMTVGVGLYAPCMALVYALGMNPSVAFPIMMGSCAFLMPIASLKFIKEGAYNKKASIPITIGGILGVLLAAYVVKSLNTDLLMWVVLIAVIYTAGKLFLDSRTN